MTAIATFIMVCFGLFVLAFVAKLIIGVQQSKKSIKIQTGEITADEVDSFQKLAGIKPTNPNDELRQILVKNNLNGEKLKEELKKEFENSEFPAPDPSIPVITAKLTTIQLGSKEEVDPLASVPMSRVSKEGKQKMAEIAKQDISERLEENSKLRFPEGMEYTDEYYKSTLPIEIKEALVNAEPITQTEYNLRRDKMAEELNQKKCGCGRSETGFCTGLHRIPKADWENGVREILELPKIKAVASENDQRLGIELVKPKTKKRNPKQMDGIKSEGEFKKTRKKATKKENK